MQTIKNSRRYIYLRNNIRIWHRDFRKGKIRRIEILENEKDFGSPDLAFSKISIPNPNIISWINLSSWIFYSFEYFFLQSRLESCQLSPKQRSKHPAMNRDTNLAALKKIAPSVRPVLKSLSFHFRIYPAHHLKNHFVFISSFRDLEVYISVKIDPG